MVDSSMVAVPRLPNSREENKSIKNGLNISAIRIRLRFDVKHKPIRCDEVRLAWVHDDHVWQELRTENNSHQDEWTGSASDRS